MQNLKWIIQPLSAFALGMLLLLNFTLYLFWYKPGLTNLTSANQQLGKSMAQSLAFEATTALYSGNRAVLSNILNRFADQPQITNASVTSEELNGLQLSSRPSASATNGVSFRFPIHFGEELLGHAEIWLSRENMRYWQSQATTSWLLFNLMSIGGLGSFIFWRSQAHERRWKSISSALQEQLPDIYSQLSGTPEKQLEQLVKALQDPLARQGQLLKHLRASEFNVDTERLLEQIELVNDQGSYQDVALLAVQCQNWDELIRTHDASSLQNLWEFYESLVIRVGELYSGVLLPDGFSLVFGLNGDAQFAENAICAARVLQLALEQVEADSHELQPCFGIAVSAGPAFVSKTHKHGLPLPLVTGDADTWLSQIKAMQPVNQVLLAEPMLQFEDVNHQIEAAYYRDITLRNGQRLEIWELEKLKGRDELLMIQADTLIKSNNP